MGITEDIHQSKPFANEHQKAIVNIIYTSNWLISQMQTLLKPFDITHQQFNVLRILRGQYPGTLGVNDIKIRMVDHHCDVSRIVERLRKKDLLDRQTNPQDRRKVHVVITNKGLNLLEELDNELPKIHKLLNGLSQGAVETLNEILDKARE